jgi:pimeloyl-ACP methyl ester carboxylesterase
MGLLLLFLYSFLLLSVLGAAAMTWMVLRPPRRSMGSALARGYPTEPKDIGLVGVERQLALADGASTAGFVVDGQKPEGPLAVILHGHASSRFSALARAQWLAPHCARVVCFDWRGHGDARGPGAAGCDFGAKAGADVAQVVAQTQASPAQKVVLMGCSMGAACALRAALSPELAPRVAALVLDGLYRHWHTGVANRLAERRKPVYFFFLVAFVVERLLPHLRHEDTADYAAKVKCPVLFLHGEADRACPIEATRHVAACVEGGRAEFVSFPGAGHLGLHRADPARYDAAVREFFAGLAAHAPHPPHPFLAQ